MNKNHWLMTPVLLLAGGDVVAEQVIPHSSSLDNDGLVIGRVILEKSDVFDFFNPDEDKALFRLANKLHIITKDGLIEQHLLFQSSSI